MTRRLPGGLRGRHDRRRRPARAELSAIYPGNLCVHPVQYSASKLAGIAEQLRSVSSTPIQAEALVIENKVRVSVVALDPPTSAILDGSAGRR